MLPSNRRSEAEALQKARSGYDTLPPPGWTAPRAAGRSPTTMVPKPLTRRIGVRAEEAWLRARVKEARAAGDTAALGTACATLARWLASRDRDLDEAAELGSTALQVAPDVELRRELSAWLESLGEHARAAFLLKPIAALPDVESTDAANLFVRVGILRARAGAAAAAAAAFEAALSVDDANALAGELLGALSAWQPDVLSAAGAADAYLESARRRGALKQDDAELLDLWRAFAADPSNDAVAGAVAAALDRRTRMSAADEVLRVHALALAPGDPLASSRVHARRRAAAIAARDPVRALAAALDEDLAAQVDGDESAAFDALLRDLGMLDVVAARLEMRAQRGRNPVERALRFVQLARLHAGPLADRGQAVRACVSALAADPACDKAVTTLRELLGGGELPSDHGAPAGDPLGGILASIAAATDEAARRDLLLAELRNLLPSEHGPESAAATWVRESTGGGTQAQAAALEGIAAHQSPPVRALFFAAACGFHLAAGDATAARNDAELAIQADPTNARCLAALADAATAQPRDRGAAAALERAIGVIGPRAAWCFALADALDGLGETDLAAGWSQRCVALRPGDREAIVVFLQRLGRAGDASRLRDALAWLLAQPQPVAWAAPQVASALTVLSRLDASRASVVARRALDVFGAKSAALREAMLGIAEQTSDEGFAVAVLERTLSCSAEGVDRRALLEDLVRRRRRLGDGEGVARIAARAASEGLPEPHLGECSELASCGLASPDAQVWALRARALRLSPDEDVASAVATWRELGAAMWDLAEDRVGAIDAWQRAARLAPGGHTTLALDLTTFAGAAFAFDYLARVVETEPEDTIAAAVATEASRAALCVSETRFAFDLAARGVARHPASADALEAAELSAQPAGEPVRLSALYDLVASQALGRFGRRAAHYRGARLFERSGMHSLALKHAAQAFIAVPSEGSTLQSLARTAERAGDRLLAARTIEYVAEREERAPVRAAWLRRAASLAGEGEQGARRKFDLLLRAFIASPSLATASALGDVTRQLLRFGPGERAGLELRLGHAARSSGAQLNGPEGARVAIAFALTQLDLFGESDGALASLERAFACDPDVDEFGQLASWASAIAQAQGARGRVAAMLASADDPHANVGVAALRLLAAIAAAAGDGGLRARASVAAALRSPDDVALVIEADDAIVALRSGSGASPEEVARIADRIAPQRRAAALIAIARSRMAEGAPGEAATRFERAVDLLDQGGRAEVERELRLALDAAGRRSEIEARALREATDPNASVLARADAWTQVAELREQSGDPAGATRALLEACLLDPEPLARWSSVERVADAAGDDTARIEALERILERVGDDGRANVLKRLARAYERHSDLEAAERTWRRVLAIDSEDEKVDQAIQSLIVARGAYDELVDHLAHRAARLSGRPDSRELLRALRLRRAAILEQRLGRTSDACEELEVLLRDWPDSVPALRYLADLYDRQANFVRSVPLWRQAAALEDSQPDSEDLKLRAARASRAAGDLVAAHHHGSPLPPPDPQSDAKAQTRRGRDRRMDERPLRIEAAQALSADADLSDALDDVAWEPSNDARTRANMLLQSARAALRAGDLADALGRARRAVEAAPNLAASQLLARRLEYGLRGAGAPDEARSTIEELTRIGEPLGPEDAALRAFLLAESLDVVQGGGAGLRELEAARAAIGNHAVIALGLADRLVAQGEFDAATEAYRVALAGPLLELRSPASVALLGAEAAIRAGSTADASYFVGAAEEHDDGRAAAAALRQRLRDLPVSIEPTADVRIYDLEAAVHGARDAVERASARLALARGRLDFGDFRGAEPLLWEALADGLTEAGDVLAPLIASSPDRATELVRLRWQQVALEPGEVERLQSLRAAALAADDRAHALAVEHVLRAFDPSAGALTAPPLAAQPEQPGILALLSRPSMDAAGEALALLWESAMQLFVRDAASYGITGVERVEPGPSSAISRLYEVAVRVLDVPRVPLFVIRTSASPLDSRVALLSPPSVILTGDVQHETAELRFELGRGLTSALSHNVLRQGLPKVEGHAVVAALRTAFGPPELGRQVDARVARLAEAFWQIIPASTQRRLQELLRTAALSNYEDLVDAAVQSGRRVGMFLAGDFACAAHSVLAELAVQDEATRELLASVPASLENLRALCLAVPALADLLRLAARSEYADARWHSLGSSSPRRTPSSGRFSLF